MKALAPLLWLLAMLLAPIAWAEPLLGGHVRPGDTVEARSADGSGEAVTYVIKELLGHGTFAAVYLVSVIKDGKERGERALKLVRLREDPTGNLAVARNGYDRVATAANGIPPSTLFGFDPTRRTTVLGKNGRGGVYRAIEMDVADGSVREALGEFRLRPRDSEGQLAERLTSAEGLLRDAMAAFRDLLALGLHHGDIKPGNFLKTTLGGNTVWKLGDLDGVSAIGETTQYNLLTAAPEQLRHRSTAGSDPFSLASTLHDVMFGHSPAHDYLTTHDPKGLLPAKGDGIVAALTDLYSHPEKHAEMVAKIKGNFDYYENKFPNQAPRLQALRDFVVAGITVDPLKRIAALSKIPAAQEWAKQTQVFRLENQVLHQFCQFAYRILGWGSRFHLPFRPAIPMRAPAAVAY